MYCIKCGAELNENAKFCSKCGALVTAVTPANIQTPAVQPPVNAQSAKRNPFAYISMGITAMLTVLFFLPSVVVNGKGFSMFACVVRILEMDIVPFTFCALLMWAAEVLLIIAFINMLTKKRNVIGLIIPASGITVFTLFFFWLTDYAISFATTTVVPVLMLLMAIANVIIINIARKVK